VKHLSLTLMLIFSLVLFAGCSDNETVAPEPTETTRDSAPASIPEAQVETQSMAPLTEAEFQKFIKDIPEITRLTNPTINAEGPKDPEVLSAKIAEVTTSLGWDQQRFLYVYGQAMTVMNYEQMVLMKRQMDEQIQGLTEEEQKMVEEMMAQQPQGQLEAVKQQVDRQVSPAEQQIIRDNLTALEEALGLR